MKKVNPNSKIIIYLDFLLTTLVLTIAIAILLLITFQISLHSVFYIFFTMLIVGVIVSAKLTDLSYDSYSYELQKECIYIKAGFIWKKSISIPYSKIQNVDITIGPIDSVLKTCKLQIQTASNNESAPDGVIPYISESEAKKIKEEILSKISQKQKK